MLNFVYFASIHDFKILKIFQKCRNFPRIFIEKRHRRQPPAPNVHMTFLVDKIVTLPLGAGTR